MYLCKRLSVRYWKHIRDRDKIHRDIERYSLKEISSTFIVFSRFPSAFLSATMPKREHSFRSVFPSITSYVHLKSKKVPLSARYRTLKTVDKWLKEIRKAWGRCTYVYEGYYNLDTFMLCWDIQNNILGANNVSVTSFIYCKVLGTVEITL